MGDEVLSGTALTAAAAGLPGWWAVQNELVTSIQASDFPAAVGLFGRIAEVAEELNHHPDVDVRWRTLYLRLTTHSAGGVTEADLGLARRIIDIAEQAGVSTSPPSVAKVEVGVDVMSVERVLPFWTTVSGYTAVQTGDGWVLRDPAGRGPQIFFQQMTAPRMARSRTHLDFCVSEAAARERLDAAVRAGGRLVTDEFAPSWWVLADPEGNEVCLCTV